MTDPAPRADVPPLRDGHPAGPPAPPRSRRHQLIIAHEGGARRAGAWSPAANVYVLTAMGGSVLDFRDAELPPGTTTVWVLALMGGVEIIAPPWLRVESRGLGLMGGFAKAPDPDGGTEEAGPVLRVYGLAVMGGVEITMRR